MVAIELRAMSTPFEPFNDDTTALTIAGLTIENSADRVSLSGSLDLARDRQSLDHARTLRSALDGIIAVLEAEDLPSKAAPSLKARTTKARNPFA